MNASSNSGTHAKAASSPVAAAGLFLDSSAPRRAPSRLHHRLRGDQGSCRQISPLALDGIAHHKRRRRGVHCRGELEDWT